MQRDYKKAIYSSLYICNVMLSLLN